MILTGAADRPDGVRDTIRPTQQVHRVKQGRRSTGLRRNCFSLFTASQNSFSNRPIEQLGEDQKKAF